MKRKSIGWGHSASKRYRSWTNVPAFLACLTFGTSCTVDAFETEEPVATEEAPLDVARFSGWEPIGNGLFKSAPAIARMDDDVRAVFGRGTNDLVYWNTKSSVKDWSSSWTRVSSTPVDSRPAAHWYEEVNVGKQWVVGALNGQGSLMLSARRGSPGAWSGFTVIPAFPVFKESVAMASRGGLLYVFAWATDGRYYYNAGDISRGLPGTWLHQDWQELPGGGIFTSAPAAAFSPSGARLTVVGRGTDLRYWIATGTSPADFRGWKGVGSIRYSTPPAITARAEREVDLFGTQNGKQSFCVVTNDPVIVYSVVTCPEIGGGLFKPGGPAAFGSPAKIDLVGFGLNDDHYYTARWQ